MSGGVPVSEAAMQFFVEAMRANTDTLKAVGENMKGLQNEQREQLKLINDVRERVIRIEAMPRLDRELQDIKVRLHNLEIDHAHDGGKNATWAWLAKHFPSLATVIFSLVAGMYVIMAATGRLPAREESSPYDQREVRANRDGPPPNATR